MYLGADTTTKRFEESGISFEIRPREVDQVTEVDVLSLERFVRAKFKVFKG